MSQDLTLYCNLLSPYSRVVMSVLTLLKIPHKERIMNPINGENKKEWYKKINPKMLIPAIKDGDHCMGESVDICKYLIESRKLKTPAWPVDDKEKNEQMEKDLVDFEDLGEATRNVAFNCFYAKVLGKKLGTVEEQKQYKKDLYKVYDRLEETLGKRRTKFFNSDEHPALQDYLFYNLIRVVFDINMVTLENHPMIRQWMEACGKVPSIATINVRLDKEMKKIRFLIKWVLPIMRCITCKCCC
ncbi:unnamed protein product [Moneuplotes crassus]|uniref:Glutathione S-transferase n=2 Tax=Euplotes crassus TaxID=5936 RepID=A0AAD1XRP2_EUPCR|nr:unnamed protein product [Moneuplotes crassus]